MKEKVAFEMSQIITPKPNTQFDKLEYSKQRFTFSWVYVFRWEWKVDLGCKGFLKID